MRAGYLRPVGALPAAGMIEAHPLANRVARGEEETLFEELRAERTGIDFGLSWDDPASVLKEFIFLNPSGGICTGDCDGDGLVDKEEFRNAIPKMGIPMMASIPTQDIDDLFDTLDVDGSGAISYKELKKLLTMYANIASSSDDSHGVARYIGGSLALRYGARLPHTVRRPEP